MAVLEKVSVGGRQGRPCTPGGPKRDHFGAPLCGRQSSFAPENKQLYAFITLTLFICTSLTRLATIILLLIR